MEGKLGELSLSSRDLQTGHKIWRWKEIWFCAELRVLKDIRRQFCSVRDTDSQSKLIMFFRLIVFKILPLSFKVIIKKYLYTLVSCEDTPWVIPEACRHTVSTAVIPEACKHTPKVQLWYQRPVDTPWGIVVIPRPVDTSWGTAVIPKACRHILRYSCDTRGL